MTHIALQAVVSSQIAAIGYDADTQTMAIQFKNWKGEIGSTYHYANVSADDFIAFRDAESQGKHFGKHFKPHADRYPYTRMDAPPAARAA